MHNREKARGAASRRPVAAGAAALALFAVFPVGGAGAQQLKQVFTNPSFGGNPFYSEHLLGIANIHRPAEPQNPPLTQEELLIRQIQSRLAGQISGEIETRIAQARPGESGEFVLGDQIVRFVRTETQTTVTFLNTRTGESSQLVIPVRAASNSSPNPNQPGCQPGNPFCASGTSFSAEALLGAKSGLAPASPLAPGSLSAGSLEVPLGPPGL